MLGMVHLLKGPLYIKIWYHKRCPFSLKNKNLTNLPFPIILRTAIPPHTPVCLKDEKKLKKCFLTLLHLLMMNQGTLLKVQIKSNNNLFDRKI